MDSPADTLPQSDNFPRDLAILDWLIEMGVDEAICEDSINRFDLPKAAPKIAKPVEKPAQKEAVSTSLPQAADGLAQSCNDLQSLRACIAKFDGCDLKKGARNLVFSAGNADARVMVIGESPNKAEDQSGQPFAGQIGVLLAKMLAAIGLSAEAESPENAVYLANIIPWRAPQNRDASAAEIAVMKPFLLRQIQLVKPDFIVLMGNQACKALLETDRSVAKIRGQWDEISGIPALPMFHPANLMRNPAQKHAAWQDLLSLKQKLAGNSA